MVEAGFILVDRRVRKYLTGEERARFLAAALLWPFHPAHGEPAHRKAHGRSRHRGAAGISTQARTESLGSAA